MAVVDCVFRRIGSDAKWIYYQCIRCGKPHRSRQSDPLAIHRDCANRGMPRVFTPAYVYLKGIAPEPGSVLQSLIKHATNGKIQHGIGCEQMRLRMNHWGWRGCFEYRAAILKRIREQATREGFRSDAPALAIGLLVGCYRAMLARWESRRV